MKINYDQFAAKYGSSGLTQKAFGDLQGMSSSMVGYYLRRWRETRSVDSGFVPIVVDKPENESKSIIITTPAGLNIEIPM